MHSFPRFIRFFATPYLKPSALAVAGLLALSSAAHAEVTPETGIKTVSPEVAQAVDALKSGDGARAAAFLRPVAEKGDPAAQALLGQIYLDGNGIDKDMFEAGRWLRSAAANGVPSGAFALATLTEDGTLTPPGMDANDTQARIIEATRLYLVAANNGSVPGQIESGLRYARGLGTTQNMVEAARWFREAANAGSGAGEFNLGALHASGALNSGTPDHTSAKTWFEKAAAKGHPDAQYNLGLAAAQGLGQPVDNTTAARWFTAAAGHNLPDAQAALAYLTYHGLGTPKDEAKAFDLYAKAAEQGNQLAQNRLARLYVMGRGVTQDMAKAWKWHSLAKRSGFEDTQLDARFDKNLSAQQRSSGDADAAEWLKNQSAK